MKRSWIVLRIMMHQLDAVVWVGLLGGLVLGIGTAVAGWALSQHIMQSYEAFLQRSLIGVEGTLQVKALREKEPNPALLQRFHQQWLNLPAANSVPATRRLKWSSKELLLRQKESSTWKRPLDLVFLEQGYLASKLNSVGLCSLSSVDSDLSLPLLYYGNQLLDFALPGFDRSLPLEITLNEQGVNWQQKFQPAPCLVETGLLTDQALLFLPLEAAPAELQAQVSRMEFQTHSIEENELLQAKLEKVAQSVRGEGLDKLEVKNMFTDEKLMLARVVSEQTSRLGQGIGLMILTIGMIILGLGLLLTLDFKRQSLQILRLLGMRQWDLLGGFVLGGFLVGCLTTGFAILIAVLGRFFLEQTDWISVQGFFLPDFFLQLLWVLLLPFLMAFFSGLILSGIGLRKFNY